MIARGYIKYCVINIHDEKGSWWWLVVKIHIILVMSRWSRSVQVYISLWFEFDVTQLIKKRYTDYLNVYVSVEQSCPIISYHNNGKSYLC